MDLRIADRWHLFSRKDEIMQKKYWLKMTHWRSDKPIVDKFYDPCQRKSLMGEIYYYLEQGYQVNCLKEVIV